MSELILLSITAFWLGILTSISPCPLATNIAAISFISKKLNSKRQTILSGLLYAVGRSLVYIVLNFVILLSVVSIPELSLFLQNYINKILGVILILTGMFLLELLTINIKNDWINTYSTKILNKYGIISSLIIGILFALAFCPVSAALFFGGLIPLSIKTAYGWVISIIYGVGTALPVFIFSFFLAIGFKSLNKYFQKITKIEFWSRRITGSIFILVGICYSLVYIFKVV